MYELYNGGALPVNFEIETSPLDLVQSENFDIPIFECFNTKGEIQPGKSVAVEWRFSPLEAKTYMVGQLLTMMMTSNIMHYYICFLPSFPLLSVSLSLHLH